VKNENTIEESSFAEKKKKRRSSVAEITNILHGQNQVVD
jgi:hypothetical protein